MLVIAVSGGGSAYEKNKPTPLLLNVVPFEGRSSLCVRLEICNISR